MATAAEVAKLATCFHEAAHAVVDTALGVTVSAVTVDPDGSGTCRLAPLPDDMMTSLRVAVGTLAGPLAARHFAGAGSWSAKTSPEDAAHITKAVELGADLAILKEEADELVGKHWDAIELVALGLYQRGRMTGDEVRAAVMGSLT